MDQTDELPYEAALQAGQTPVVGGVPTYKGSTPVGDTSSGLMDYESVKPISTEKEIPFEEIKPTTSSSGTPDSTTAMVGKSFLTGLQTSILDPVARLQASISDYLTHPEDLNSQEGGEVTPQQAAAAQHHLHRRKIVRGHSRPRRAQFLARLRSRFPHGFHFIALTEAAKGNGARNACGRHS